VNQLPIDPGADSSRRAWLPCPNCDHGRDCPKCQNNQNCPTHWQYLLKNAGTRVSLQCPACARRWSVDTAQMRRREREVVRTIPLGCRVHDVVISPDGAYVYATTAKSVNVIDRAHRVVATIPVDVDPKSTMVSPHGSLVYVTGYDGSIAIINTVDQTVRTIDRDASTAQVVSSPKDGYIYSAHNQGRNCWISAMSDDGTTAAVVPVDSYANALTLSPDGGKLYAASSKPPSHQRRGHGSISVIDTATFTLIEVIAMRFSPDAISVSPDGSTLYATHYNKNAISAIELDSLCHKMIRLDDAPLDIAASPDGEHVYVTNLHSVALIDTATYGVESVPTGDLPRHLDISGDGTRAYVTDFRLNRIWILDPLDKAVIATVDLGRNPEALALSANEELLYVADYLTPTLTVISLASPQPRRNRAG
jgi:YVTN family beta-propeller protein